MKLFLIEPIFPGLVLFFELRLGNFFMKKFILIFFLLLSANLSAQNDSQTIYSGQFKNVPLEEVLNDLENKFNTTFSYVDQIIGNKQITANFSKEPLSRALGLILKGTNLSFQIADSTNVIIFKRTVSEHFSITGRIVQKGSGAPLPHANILIQSLGTGDATDDLGFFKIDNLAPDTYTVKFQVIGYKTLSREILLNNNFKVIIELEIQAIPLAAIEITPGIIQISSKEAAANILTSREVLSSPNFIKDINRSIQVLPSVVSTDVRARPNIRGGNPDETAVFLDNMELLEPYHLIDSYDGPSGLVNTEVAKDIKLITGGFSAKYPDKMSGIIEINTQDEEDDHTINATLDFMMASLRLNKKINNKVSYFLSARRAYIDLVSEDLDELKSPIIYDLWSKLNYQINTRNRLSFNFLFSYDKEGYEDPRALLRPEFFDSLRKNYYGWINWDWLLNRNLYSTLTLGFQDLQKKSDFKFESSLSENNTDNHRNDVLSVRQNTFWDGSENHAFEFGFEFKRFFSNYLFSEIRSNFYATMADNVVIDSISVDSKFDGHTLSGFVQDTWKISNNLRLLLGFKISTQSYTDDVQIAPRSSISFDFADNLNLKLAYGWYYQPDEFYKLRSYDGQILPDKIVSKNIQYLGELNYRLSENTTFRLDAFYKDYKRLQDDFEFDFINRRDEAYILDKPFNPISAYSTGFETTIRHQYGNGNLLSVAYAFNKNRIKNAEGVVAPRDYDRPHTFIVNSIFDLGNGATFSALWRIHTGFPYTPSQIRTIGDNRIGGDTIIFYEFGGKNSTRVPTYRTLDIKLAKNWIFKKFNLRTYVNVINLFDRENVRSYEWDNFRHVNGRVVEWGLADTGFIPRFVSLGVGVSF